MGGGWSGRVEETASALVVVDVVAAVLIVPAAAEDDEGVGEAMPSSCRKINSASDAIARASAGGGSSLVALESMSDSTGLNVEKVTGREAASMRLPPLPIRRDLGIFLTRTSELKDTLGLFSADDEASDVSDLGRAINQCLRIILNLDSYRYSCWGSKENLTTGWPTYSISTLLEGYAEHRQQTQLLTKSSTCDKNVN
jgi:hypothetical protein